MRNLAPWSLVARDGLSPYGFFCYSKVFLDAWCTTRRIKVGNPSGSLGECVFGCSEVAKGDSQFATSCGDGLKHDLRCRSLPMVLGSLWPKSRLNSLHSIASSEAECFQVVALSSCPCNELQLHFPGSAEHHYVHGSCRRFAAESKQVMRLPVASLLCWVEPQGLAVLLANRRFI